MRLSTATPRPLALLAAAVTAACAGDPATAPRPAAGAAPGHGTHAAHAKAEARPERGGALTLSGADLAAVRAATARYHRVEVALADGFEDTRHCVAVPGAGMGVHYVHGPRVADGALDPARPEVLVYEPQADGRMRLVAVEYMIPRPMWDASHPGARPALFGHAFEDGPMDSYTLHAWVWRHNADGAFAPFNPAVRCPAGVQNP
jgi:hypothetical protein